MKKINGTWYNVSEISRMTFEEFCSTVPDYLEEKKKNIYEQITGKQVKTESKKKK